MTSFGPVTGNVIGPVQFSGGAVSFSQGAAGAGMIMKKDTTIWYVDSGQSASGNGKTPLTAFITLQEAVTTAGDYDTILIAPNSIETIAAAGIAITQDGLRIFGANSNAGSQAASLKCTGTAAMFQVSGNRFEIAYLALSQRGAYTCVEIGSATAGVVYNTHVHDCNLDGYNTGTYGVGNWTQTTAMVNLVVEDCYFAGFTTASIYMAGSRDTVRRNTIMVATSTTGIYVWNDTSGSPYTVIVDNYLFGITDAVGIEFRGTPDAGTLLLARNYLGGTWGTAITDVNAGVMNYVTNATGGTLIDC